MGDATPEVLGVFYDAHEEVGDELAPDEHVRLPTGGARGGIAFAALDATLAPFLRWR